MNILGLCQKLTIMVLKVSTFRFSSEELVEVGLARKQALDQTLENDCKAALSAMKQQAAVPEEVPHPPPHCWCMCRGRTWSVREPALILLSVCLALSLALSLSLCLSLNLSLSVGDEAAGRCPRRSAVHPRPETRNPKPET